MNAPITSIPLGDLKLHPTAGIMPEPSNRDRAALRADLAEHGQRDPIDVTPDGLILDGRTRWQLGQELGWLTIDAREHELPKREQVMFIARSGIARRHLTPKQRATVIADMVIKVGPKGELVGFSVGDVAKLAGTSPKTAERARAASTAGPDHIETADPKNPGETKLQPAKQAKAPAKVPKGEAESERDYAWLVKTLAEAAPPRLARFLASPHCEALDLSILEGYIDNLYAPLLTRRNELEVVEAAAAVA